MLVEFLTVLVLVVCIPTPGGVISGVRTTERTIRHKVLSLPKRNKGLQVEQITEDMGIKQAEQNLSRHVQIVNTAPAL